MEICFGHFYSLYSINKTTGSATLIGPLGSGITGQNALVFGSDCKMLIRRRIQFNQPVHRQHLYWCCHDPRKCRAFLQRAIWHLRGGYLYLADTNNKLLKIDLNNLSNSVEVGPFGFSNVFGLATADNNVMYGLSGTQVFSVDTATGVGTLVSTYGLPLTGANGSAFFTEFWRERSHTRCPPTAWLWFNQSLHHQT